MSYVTLGLTLIGGERDGAASLLQETFLASLWTPCYIHTSLHVRRPGCLCGVWTWRQTGKGAKRKQHCPGYTLPPLHEHKTPSSPYPFPSISCRPDKFTVLCIWVWQQQPSLCDGPNSSGLPTPGVVSPSSLLILGSRCTHMQRPCQCKTWSTTPLRVHSFYQEGIFFAVETHIFCKMPRASSGLWLLFQSFKV